MLGHENLSRCPFGQIWPLMSLREQPRGDPGAEPPPAAVRDRLPGEQPEQRRLARAVGAEHRRSCLTLYQTVTRLADVGS